MHLAVPCQPAQPLGTGRGMVFEMVTGSSTSHGNSWDHKHFWDPQGKREAIAAAGDLQVLRGP